MTSATLQHERAVRGWRLTGAVDLFEPVALGALQLPNRLVMSPLTRRRTDDAGIPDDLTATYYAQRASAGLLITEGTWPTREGRSWIRQPGIETPEQIAGWRRVTDAVHGAGGRIVMQIMHGGRISHPVVTGTGRTVAPSAITPPGALPLPEGASVPFVQPHELTTEEIAGIIEVFVAGACNAVAAGMDGVQIHVANGYLLHQFLAPTSNTRTDAYGGSPIARARLIVELLTAVVDAIGPERTGLRLSPERDIQGVVEQDAAETLATYTAVADGLAPLGLAFLDMLHADAGSPLVRTIRERVGAPLIASPGGSTRTSRGEAADIMARGLADAVGVGRAFIANPDLVERWRTGAVENLPDPGTFYEGDAVGYTDYPFLDDVAQEDLTERAG